MYSVFEFVHALIDTARFRSTVKGTIDQIIYYVIIYMQMTEDQVLESCGLCLFLLICVLFFCSVLFALI